MLRRVVIVCFMSLFLTSCLGSAAAKFGIHVGLNAAGDLIEYSQEDTYGNDNPDGNTGFSWEEEEQAP